jgi:hypothetical protein
MRYNRDFRPDREYLTVKWPAGTALRHITKGRDIGRTFQEKRENYREILTRLDAEHWFTILAWDKSSPEEWLEAAEHLVEAAPPDPTQLTEVLEADEGPRLFGEPMRQRREPSVIGLLDRRADSMAAVAKCDPKMIRDFPAACRRFQIACRLSLCLAKWDRPYGVPECRRRLHEYRDFASNRLWQPYTPELYGDVSRLFTEGIDAGDEEFIDSYIAWMTNLKPEPSSLTIGLDVFQPLSRAPDSMKLMRLGKKLFRAGSPWMPMQSQLGPRWDRLLTSPLIVVPTFRGHVRSQLQDTKPFGEATVDPDSLTLKVRFAGGQRSEEISAAFGRGEPPPNPQPVRFCDFVAWRLSHLQGAPQFEVWWSEAKRDTALEAMSEFLKRWGPAFRASGPPVEPFGSPSHIAQFRLPKPVKPAEAEPPTEADVKAGRAIFSLRKEGAEVRVVPLPTWPQPARWKTLTDFPVQTLGPPDSVTGNPTRVKSFDQEGVIWQAEEVLVEGEWRRFYGFVGRHVVAKVPAAEIELGERK